MKLRAGIFGISGYAGVELHRILSAHPSVSLAALAAGRAAGSALGASWPGLEGYPLQDIDTPEPARLAEQCDVVFLAMPHGQSAPLAAALLERGRTVIDLGADFRLRDPAAWARTYGSAHPHPERIGDAVYGLPGLHRDALRGTRLVANPGLPHGHRPGRAAPRAGRARRLRRVGLPLRDLGRGTEARAPDPGEVHEQAVAYAVGGTHRHVPEMEQTLGVPVAFTPHLAPMSRGMLATVTVRLRPGSPLLDGGIVDLYAEACAPHPAWQLAPAPPSTREVRGTGFARVFPTVDPTRRVATVTCAIDNLGRSAAARAVQCMNLAMGLPEMQGVPVHPFLP